MPVMHPYAVFFFLFSESSFEDFFLIFTYLRYFICLFIIAYVNRRTHKTGIVVLVVICCCVDKISENSLFHF